MALGEALKRRSGLADSSLLDRSGVRCPNLAQLILFAAMKRRHLFEDFSATEAHAMPAQKRSRENMWRRNLLGDYDSCKGLLSCLQL